MVLPEGFAIPPLPHLLALAAGAAAVGGLLWRRRPPVTSGAITALAPWMLVGAALHALYQVGGAPTLVAPLVGAPAVYATTAIVAGAVWLVALHAGESPDRRLGGAGAAAFVLVAAFLLAVGEVVRVAVPLAALAGALVLGGGTWLLLRRRRPGAAAATGSVGLLVVLGHAIDGVSTAVGVDVLGFGERTPASRAIMDLAGALPTAEVVGVGWLFVLVKLVVAAAVVVLFADYVREEPGPGFGLLGVIAAVGLGPGVHNLLLYAVAA